MTITTLDTYADLLAAIASYNFEKTDIPTAVCVKLAEAEMRSDTELILRMEESDNALVGVPSSRLIALPTGFQRPLTLWRLLDDGSRDDPMQLVPAANMQASVATGIPRFWAIDGANIAFERPVDQAYSFVLRAEMNLTALSVSNTTNWLLTNYPQLYLTACMVQAALWLQDDDQLSKWTNAYETVRSRVSTSESKARGTPPLSTEAAMLNRCGYNIYTGQ